jgi:hypothetical protein
MPLETKVGSPIPKKAKKAVGGFTAINASKEDETDFKLDDIETKQEEIDDDIDEAV